MSLAVITLPVTSVDDIIYLLVMIYYRPVVFGSYFLMACSPQGMYVSLSNGWSYTSVWWGRER